MKTALLERFFYTFKHILECFLTLLFQLKPLNKMNKLKLFKLAGTVAMAAKNEDGSFIDRSKAFIRMIKDTVAGRYKPKKRNMLMGAAVVAYVLSPIDLIPAVILDDAAIVFIALKFFNREIERYLDWERNSKYKTIVTDVKDVEIVKD